MGEPLGVVLAGGRGRRIGGDKALVSLGGKPLLSYPVSAMREAAGEVAVLAKPDTRLPDLAGVTVWRDATDAQHPVVGLREALGRAAGRAVLVCAGDMPFVPGELLRAIAATDPDGAPAVVAASGGGEVQPLLGCYLPQALAMLPSSDRPLREIVEAIGPRRFEVADPLALFNVNTPGDLERAEAVLVSRASQM